MSATANLIRGESSDPEIAARQRSHLIPGGRKHGAYGGPELDRLRAGHGERLLAEFPSMHASRRALLADLLARVELVWSWTAENGLMPTAANRRGETFPVIDRLDRWSARADALIAQAEAHEREQGAQRSRKSLDEVVAEAIAEQEQRDRAGEA